MPLTVNPADQMAVSLARQIKDGERVFHGVASPLPMIAILLAKRLHAPHAVYLNIGGGVDAQPGALPFSTVSPVLLKDTPAIFSLIDIFDLSARGELDLAFLGGVQIDSYGQINLSVIGDFNHPKVRLPGGAGAAAIMPTAKRTVLWRTRHDPKTIVERCSFVSAAGRTDRVVTPLCVFRMADHKLEVEYLHPGVTFDEVQNQTGFTLSAEGCIREALPPTPDELKILKEIDPQRVRDVEFR